MNAPTNTQLSAPTNDFLADLERFGVPFGREINGHYISSPPAAWERVFNGPHDASGRPLVGGGLRASDVALMKQEAADRHRRNEKQHTAGPTPDLPCQRYSPAVTAPPAREPAGDAGTTTIAAPQGPMKKAQP